MDKVLGWKNILFTLSILFLLGLTLLLYSELNFIFSPIFRMIAAVLTPLIISLILYYLVSPLVDFLEEKGVPRLVAIIGMYLFILGLIVLLLLWLIPMLQDQLESLINGLPMLFDQAQEFLTGIVGNFLTTDNQRDIFQQGLDYFGDIESNLMNYVTEGFSGIGTFIMSVTNIVLMLFLVPIILFFLLKDGSNFYQSFMEKYLQNTVIM